MGFGIVIDKWITEYGVPPANKIVCGTGKVLVSVLVAITKI
jgi:hypothetical protein